MNEPVTLTISAFTRLQQDQGHNPVALTRQMQKNHVNELGAAQVPHAKDST